MRIIMAYAICTKCGKQHHWRACRGSRLSDLKSPCCDAPLRKRTAEDEKRIYAEMDSKAEMSVFNDLRTSEAST